MPGPRHVLDAAVLPVRVPPGAPVSCICSDLRGNVFCNQSVNPVGMRPSDVAELVVEGLEDNELTRSKLRGIQG